MYVRAVTKVRPGIVCQQLDNVPVMINFCASICCYVWHSILPFTRIQFPHLKIPVSKPKLPGRTLWIVPIGTMDTVLMMYPKSVIAENVCARFVLDEHYGASLGSKTGMVGWSRLIVNIRRTFTASAFIIIVIIIVIIIIINIFNMA